MAREAPNPFGTSLIDLLVSGLAMVAMLWVMNATKNGLLGTGDEETTSGMVLLEQFGASHHMKEVSINLPGIWTCQFELVWEESPPVAKSRGCVAESGSAIATGLDADDGRIAFSAPGVPPGVVTTVLLRLEAPGGAFFNSLTISVDKLAGQNLDVDVAIQPCCDSNQPHYLRLSVFSGAGHGELISFWQEAELLGQVFDTPDRLPGGEFPDPIPVKVEPWILDLRDAIAVGKANPVRTLFDVPAGQSCSDLWSAKLPTLSLTFESEGEIQVALPASTGTSLEFAAVHAQFDNLLSAYLAWLDEVRP